MLNILARYHLEKKKNVIIITGRKSCINISKSFELQDLTSIVTSYLSSLVNLATQSEPIVSSSSSFREEGLATSAEISSKRFSSLENRKGEKPKQINARK